MSTMRTESIRIPVSGMTCAACSARVQRTLQKQPGVADANVNLMMKTATVQYDPTTVSPDRLVDAIKATGYGAQLASPDQSAFEEQEARDRAQEEEFHELKLKAIVSGIIGVIAMIVSMPLMTRTADALGGHAHGESGDPFMRWAMSWLDAPLRAALPWLYAVPAQAISYVLLIATLGVMVWAGRHFYTRARV
jgi:P-type Cu+ transporter